MNQFRSVAPCEWGSSVGENIRLEIGGGGAIALHFLEWDTKFFGLPCYLFDYDHTSPPSENPRSSHFSFKDWPHAAVWAKIPVAAPNTFLTSLQDLGFRIIETEVNLEFQASGAGPTAVDGIDVRIERAPAAELPSALGEGFTNTRFHLDPKIGPSKADELWRSYICNYKSKDTGLVFTAVERGTNSATGVVLVSEIDLQGSTAYCVDLIVVAPAWRSKRIGSLLLQSTVKHLSGPGVRIVVSTQDRNTAAINFYVRNGFSRFLPARTVLHWWTKG